MDTAAVGFSHMETVAQTIHLLNGHDADRVRAGEIQTRILLGLPPGPNAFTGKGTSTPEFATAR